ncbi:uncharacterized protein LOC106735395 [Tupaia chinensis]|uniref:uncharacterized protein LOC106735395 n=1 Tax=Tupaia chinensis TaxID=246437 RepID=UPI000704718E|nr:uncharacterized protein LOC106735395 [Tupaia chinensis]
MCQAWSPWSGTGDRDQAVTEHHRAGTCPLSHAIILFSHHKPCGEVKATYNTGHRELNCSEDCLHPLSNFSRPFSHECVPAALTEAPPVKIATTGLPVAGSTGQATTTSSRPTSRHYCTKPTARSSWAHCPHRFSGRQLSCFFSSASLASLILLAPPLAPGSWCGSAPGPRLSSIYILSQGDLSHFLGFQYPCLQRAPNSHLTSVLSPTFRTLPSTQRPLSILSWLSDRTPSRPMFKTDF